MAQLSSRLQDLRSNGTLCDVTLVSKDGRAERAHSAVMAASSAILEKVVCDSFRDVEEKTDVTEACVQLDDVTHGDILASLVDFVYTGRCDVTVSSLEELSHVAETLKLNQLHKLCLEKLKADFGEPNNNESSKKLAGSIEAEHGEKMEADDEDEFDGHQGAEDARGRLRETLKRKLSSVSEILPFYMDLFCC